MAVRLVRRESLIGGEALPVRNIFGAGMTFSLVGAGVLSGVLAWKNHSSVDSQAILGMLEVDFGSANSLLVTPPLPPLLMPGQTAHLVSGQLRNTGTYPFMLDASSKVEVTGITTVGVLPADPPCALTNFTAKFVDEALGDNQRQVKPGFVGAPFHVEVLVNANAPQSCSEQDLSYKISVAVRNIPPAQAFGQ